MCTFFRWAWPVPLVVSYPVDQNLRASAIFGHTILHIHITYKDSKLHYDYMWHLDCLFDLQTDRQTDRHSWVLFFCACLQDWSTSAKVPPQEYLEPECPDLYMVCWLLLSNQNPWCWITQSGKDWGINRVVAGCYGNTQSDQHELGLYAPNKPLLCLLFTWVNVASQVAQHLYSTSW